MFAEVMFCHMGKWLSRWSTGTPIILFEVNTSTVLEAPGITAAVIALQLFVYTLYISK